MNRQQRRNAYKSMGILKNKSSRQFNDPTRRQITEQLSREGAQKHKAMVEANERKLHEEMEHRLAEYKKTLEVAGWKDKEIEKLAEAWMLRAVKDKDNYQQDKKDAKRLTKEAEALKAKRTK
tara:strand:- start:355 stop:720 length:366 start_codon:yes stop_codon:yes gene_type:complete